MIAPTALRLAGDGAHLVARPNSRVVHLHTGPLTPSGRFIPRRGRTVCRAHTLRLHLVRDFDPLAPGARRVCARCSARLAGEGERAELPVSREDWLTAYADLTAFDLVIDSLFATSVEEVERLEFLALLPGGAGRGLPDCRDQPVVAPTGKATRPLDAHLRRARTRVGGARREELERSDRANELFIAAASRTKADRKEISRAREQRQRALGAFDATA